jgi:hypothetical protein
MQGAKMIAKHFLLRGPILIGGADIGHFAICLNTYRCSYVVLRAGFRFSHRKVHRETTSNFNVVTVPVDYRIICLKYHTFQLLEVQRWANTEGISAR